MKLDQLSPAISQQRVVGIVATLLAHMVMIITWQATRQAPLSNGVEPPSFILVKLPQRVSVPHDPSTDNQRRITLGQGAGGGAGSTTGHPHLKPTAPLSAHIDETDASTADPSTANGVDGVPPDRGPTVPLHPMLDQAKRDVGAIDRTLRRENRAYIVAPLDSPQIRMRKKIEEAAALAPRHFWEAPKIEEVVNDSGDGTRRTRVTTGGRTYCVTERSFATGIDMVEKHGKQMITNCSRDNEKPVGDTQAWRTARD